MSTPYRPAMHHAWRLLPLGMAVASPLLAAEPLNLDAVNVTGFSEQESA
ncbi:TonB-denpendent receptor, partial [Pseudomonas syringae pv. actinidiae]|nr:TonB-denpendent receptor [Pseudomonas syringae pv. actinidiae]